MSVFAHLFTLLPFSNSVLAKLTINTFTGMCPAVSCGFLAYPEILVSPHNRYNVGDPNPRGGANRQGGSKYSLNPRGGSYGSRILEAIAWSRINSGQTLYNSDQDVPAFI